MFHHTKLWWCDFILSMEHPKLRYLWQACAMYPTILTPRIEFNWLPNKRLPQIDSAFELVADAINNHIKLAVQCLRPNWVCILQLFASFLFSFSTPLSLSHSRFLEWICNALRLTYTETEQVYSLFCDGWHDDIEKGTLILRISFSIVFVDTHARTHIRTHAHMAVRIQVWARASAQQPQFCRIMCAHVRRLMPEPRESLMNFRFSFVNILSCYSLPNNHNIFRNDKKRAHSEEQRFGFNAWLRARRN